MTLITIGNLYPRPDQPQRGMFNAQLFRAMASLLAGDPAEPSGGDEGAGLINACLVPEWRCWRWPAIRAWRDPQPAPYITQYLPVSYVPGLGRDWSWWTYRGGLRPLQAHVRGDETVLATWLYPDAAAAAWFAGEHGLPLWILVLGSDTFHLEHARRRAVIRAACLQAAGVLCVCQPLADWLVRAGIAAGKVHVAPNGVDTELFRFRPPDEAWRTLAAVGAAPGAGPTVLFVGNLVPVKGPDLLLAAWQRIVSGGGQLLIIGDGPLRRPLTDQCAQLGLGGSVHFLGSRPHREIALWMNAADCLCLCSRSEGMPNVVLEALASGLPVVAPDVGACRELLADEDSCRVVSAPASPAALAAAVRDVLAGGGQRAELARRQGTRRSWQAQARQILTLIKDRAQ